MSDFAPPKNVDELKVLVVDDQTLVHTIIQSALKDLGVKKVVCTQNAYRALRECETSKFDIFVLAFNASDDKDGFHLLEELRLYNHINEQTTVIFLSAETSPQLVNCIIEMQPHDFWVKPLNTRRIEQRFKHLFAARLALHKLTCCLMENDFAATVYQAERLLAIDKFKEFHNKLRRIKGDCLIRLFAFEDAEQYFSRLAEEFEAGWIRVGWVRALLKQQKYAQAQSHIDELLARDDTRFPIYDLLAQHNIEKGEYADAYAQMKQACELAPRNMDRNKKLWDLARLNHDRMGQLRAVHAMAKFAKNSIHDSPMLSINVMRANIDLAATVTGEESQILMKRAVSLLNKLESENPNCKELADVFTITRARIASLNNDKKTAEEIIENSEIGNTVNNVEDGLDKMKVFHELGMRENCLAILDKLKEHIEGDNFSNEVVNAYICQEAIERQSINFSTKELKQMAATHFQNARYQPALDLLKQAQVLSPDDISVALNLLKVAACMKKNDDLTEDDSALIDDVQNKLSGSKLNEAQQAKFESYQAQLAA